MSSFWRHFARTLACGLLLAGMASPVSARFAKGADVSWMTQMEAAGYRFLNEAGKPQDLLQILKGKGIDSIRLRVWVNPADGWSGLNDVLAKARRARKQGMRLMLAFHYSDSWAHPERQSKPAAWQKLSFEQLNTAVWQHTHEVMTALAREGIYPEWVQVGNETNHGMLWEDGRSDGNVRNFVRLLNTGHDAVKAVSPRSQVVVHLANGYDNQAFRRSFDALRDQGAKWDVIGMSLYPSTTNWPTLSTQTLANLRDMKSRYGKDVMITEIGMDHSATTASRAFIQDLLLKARAAGALGVFYWEPQAHNNWQQYTLGAWGNDGRPGAALDAFLEGSETAPAPAASAPANQNIPAPGNARPVTGHGLALSAEVRGAHITLNWNPEAWPSPYLEVFRSTEANPASRERIAAGAANNGSFIDTEAVPGQQYWYWLKQTVKGVVSNSASASARIPAEASTPAQPALRGNGETPDGFAKCAESGQTCYVTSGSGWVAYGRDGRWVSRYIGLGRSVKCAPQSFSKEPGGQANVCAYQR